MHDSLKTYSFEGICNRHQQSTRMEVHTPYPTLPYRLGLDVAGRLVDNALYDKLAEDQVLISLKRTFMYFRDFSFSPFFLKVHKNSHSMVKLLFFIIENIQINHCICLLLILPFKIGFALSGIIFLKKCDFVTFSRKMIFLKEVSIV